MSKVRVLEKVGFFQMCACMPTVHSGHNQGVRGTFGHKFAKKSDIDVVEGLLEAYYEDKHKKMTKSEI